MNEGTFVRAFNEKIITTDLEYASLLLNPPVRMLSGKRCILKFWYFYH